MKYESLKLDNQLCFALYASSKEVTKLYQPYLQEIGITYTQYIVFLVLWEKDNITVKELGDKLFLDSGTLTPLLKKLESIGFLTRERAKEDERSVFIKLTEKGIALRESAAEIPSKIFCATGMCSEDALLLKEKLKLLLSLIK